MIGYSQNAKTRYHKVHPAWGRYPHWAKCDVMGRLDYTYDDDQEARLKKAAPHLSRCPRCWKEEK